MATLPLEHRNRRVGLYGLLGALAMLGLLGLSHYDREQRVVGFVAETRRLAAERGLRLRVLSGGGTGTQAAIAAMGSTEARMGCYCWEGQERLYPLPPICIAFPLCLCVCPCVTGSFAGAVTHCPT